GYVLVALVAAAEGALLVGLVLPGEATMLLGGVLVARGRAEAAVMLAAGGLGAVLGDSVGFGLGRRLGPKLQQGVLGRRIGAARWRRANDHLRRRGGRAVFAGRFVGVLRALLPAVAGQAGMPYGRFVAYNAPAAALWASGFIALGIAAGRSWRLVEAWTGRASLLLLLIGALGGALVLGARWAGRHRERLIAGRDRVLQHARIRALRRRFRPQIEFVQRRLDASQRMGLLVTVAAVLAVGAGWTFGAIVDDVLGGEELAAIDRPVIRFLAEHRDPELNTAMIVVTFFGSTLFIATALGAAALWSYVRTRNHRLVAFMAGTLVGALGLAAVIKPLVGRMRPDLDPLVEVGGYSFPSGHATGSAACFAALAYVLSRGRSWRATVWIWTAGLFAALLVAVSRVYLGVHWPTDVLGGMALGGFWAAAIAVATAALGPAPDGKR
ncbi:MAG: bifunctional DedA family/phosphatase PAP2 family protein, partial [Candidatus Rokuibacteriota bacterium]